MYGDGVDGVIDPELDHDARHDEVEGARDARHETRRPRREAVAPAGHGDHA